jgi:hypothetical protein
MFVLDQLYCVLELYSTMAGGKSDSALQLEKHGLLFLPWVVRLEQTRASCGPRNFVSSQIHDSVFKFVFTSLFLAVDTLVWFTLHFGGSSLSKYDFIFLVDFSGLFARMQVTIVDNWRLQRTGSILRTSSVTVTGKERWAESQPFFT